MEVFIPVLIIMVAVSAATLIIGGVGVVVAELYKWIKARLADAPDPPRDAIN